MNRVTYLGGFLAAMLVTTASLGHVRHDGMWPASERAVSLDVASTPRTEAVRKLADAAGWSLVIHAPPGDPVDLHVKNQPPDKVLEFLLSDAEYVAKRDGSLISIERDNSAAPATSSSSRPPSPSPSAATSLSPSPSPSHPDEDDDDDDDKESASPPHAPPPPARIATVAPAAPVAPVAPPERGKDRSVAGGNGRVEKNEVVHDLTLLGGNVEVYGTVTGDLSVMGGHAKVHDGAHVYGNATVMGGDLDVENGAVIDGEANVMGGSIRRGDHARIGGAVTAKGGKVKAGSHHDDDDDDAAESEHPRPLFVRILRALGEAMTKAAMLFVFGTVLLALAPGKMEALRAETAARPMRSLALGIVGAIGAIVLIVALTVTVIGIPVMVVGVLLAIFALYAAICAILAVVGEGLLRHKTTNPYVHLAVGCGLFTLVSALPYVGDICALVVGFIGIGVLVATRVAGIVRRKKNGGGPYRTAADAGTY
jgi:hypothetical protein